MKKLIQGALGKLGYRIYRKGNERKEIERIKEMEMLYRELVFPDYPEYDPERIELFSRLEGTNTGEAINIVYCLQKALKLEGDVCEFGVAAGHTSALMAYEIRRSEKKLWLFDSFLGLPKPSPKDRLKDDIYNLGSIEKYQGQMAYKINSVRKRLKTIKFPEERTKIIPGFIEETVKGPSLPEKICFAYVDFDFYEPIRTALNFLNLNLQKGGLAIVDDYNFFSTGAKSAVDEFISEHKGNYNFIPALKSSGNFCIIEKI